MDEFDEAKAVYALGRSLIDLAKTEYAADDRTRWLVEDLEDSLLDLKQAVLNASSSWVSTYSQECKALIAIPSNRLKEL